MPQLTSGSLFMIPLGVTGLFLSAQVSVWRTELSKVVLLTLSGHLRVRGGGG